MARIAINPSSGKPGFMVDVSGDNFGKDANILLYFDETVIARASTDDSGKLGASLTIPKAEAGLHTVRAEDSEGNIAYWTFVIM